MIMSYEALRAALQAAVAASVVDPDADGYVYVWVEDFTDTSVTYYTGGEYFTDAYVVDDAGNVTLAGAPVTVRPQTTFVPVDVGRAADVAPERRGRPGLPPELRALLDGQGPRVQVRSEPLTYQRHGRDSYFRDLVLADQSRPAADRLARHRQEMAVVGEERQRRAWRQIHAGEIEYRVEPNRTDGQGGYFAPPLWLVEAFATANRPGRVLADLIPASFDLPMGVAQVFLPIMSTGTAVAPDQDTVPPTGQDVADTAGLSPVVTLAGTSDWPLPALEQSPAGAALDWAIFTDMAEAYDADLEAQLLVGAGSGASSPQLVGLASVATTKVTYTDGSPTGSKMWPYFGQAAAQLADARLRPPEVWLMRTARWAWLMAAEDSGARPFGLPPFFLGVDDRSTPDPVGGLIGFPTFCDDAIPVVGGQDQVIACRPSDLVFLEGDPTTSAMRQVLSGSLGVRFQMHNRVAAVTNRRPAGVATVGGSGFTVQSGF